MSNMGLRKLAGRVFSVIGEQRSRNLCSTLAVGVDRGRKLYVDTQLQRNRLENVSAIRTHMTRRELCSLYDLAISCPPGATALEIGSYHGASTCYLGSGLKEIGGHLICVDTWYNETMPEGLQDTYQIFEQNTAPLNGAITVRRKRSQDLTKADIPSQLHLIFIDCDHSYESVKADVTTTAPSLVEDGVLAFHDVKYYQGVSRVVGELLSTGEWAFDASVDNLMWLRKSRPNYSDI